MTNEREELEKRAARLEKEAAEFSSKINQSKEKASKPTSAKNSTLLKTSCKLNNLKESLLGIYQKVFHPTLSFILPPVLWLGSGYSKLWNRFV